MPEQTEHRSRQAHERPPLSPAIRPPARDLPSLVREFESPLLRYAVNLLGAQRCADPEELVQEAFLRYHRQTTRHGAASIANPASWLFRVVHNLALDAIRKAGREHTGRREAAQRADAADADVLGEVIRREACDRALAELQRLSPEQKEVLLLKTIEGMTLTEISEVTGLSVGNVGYRIDQGLRTLARRLKVDGVL